MSYFVLLEIPSTFRQTAGLGNPLLDIDVGTSCIKVGLFDGEASARTGLRSGIPVVSGYVDVVASSILECSG